MLFCSRSLSRFGEKVESLPRHGFAPALGLVLVASQLSAAEPLTILNPAVEQKAPAAKPDADSKKKKPAEPWPTFDQVQKTAEKHFATLKKYRKGDLLTQSDVAPVFEQLEKLGWKVADKTEILKLFLGDRELMVRMLRTDDGRIFMRDIEKLPGGYDRVDHLSRLSDAETLLWRLTTGPDGYKMIDYMTKTTWGETMGEMISQAPNGQGFNKRTGRIYTEQQLIARLKQSYAKADKSRKKAKVSSAAAAKAAHKP